MHSFSGVHFHVDPAAIMDRGNNSGPKKIEFNRIYKPAEVLCRPSLSTGFSFGRLSRTDRWNQESICVAVANLK